LAQIGVSYHQLHVEIDECRRGGELVEDFVQRLAMEKARAGWALLGPGAQRAVLGADTLVVVDGEPLGKPGSRAQGLEMLARLSGRTHEVYSAVALVNPDTEVRLNRNKVTFRPLSCLEREAYWDSGEPRDKAGAYGIQGLAAVFIQRLEGSYSGVMGLPLFETAELLANAGLPVLPAAAVQRPTDAGRP
jgi:septum formation protein